jgi:hypothetical protein
MNDRSFASNAVIAAAATLAMLEGQACGMIDNQIDCQYDGADLGGIAKGLPLGRTWLFGIVSFGKSGLVGTVWPKIWVELDGHKVELDNVTELGMKFVEKRLSANISSADRSGDSAGADKVYSVDRGHFYFKNGRLLRVVVRDHWEESHKSGPIFGSSRSAKRFQFPLRESEVEELLGKPRSCKSSYYGG